MAQIARNNPLGFAGFAWQNFEFIERAAEHRPDNQNLHPVTQLVLSLFGLIVFPHEQGCYEFNQQVREMVPESLLEWSSWNASSHCERLEQLIENLRHAIAHAGIKFSSPSHKLSEVDVSFCKRDYDTGAIMWTAKIRADRLREFCCNFRATLEQQN